MKKNQIECGRAKLFSTVKISISILLACNAGCLPHNLKKNENNSQTKAWVEHGTLDFKNYTASPAEVYPEFVIRSRNASLAKHGAAHFQVNEWAPYLAAMKASLLEEIAGLSKQSADKEGAFHATLMETDETAEVSMRKGMHPDNLKAAQDALKQIEDVTSKAGKDALYYDEFWRIMPQYARAMSVVPTDHIDEYDHFAETIESHLAGEPPGNFFAPFMQKEGLTTEAIFLGRSGGVAASEIPTRAVGMYVDGIFRDSHEFMYHDFIHGQGEHYANEDLASQVRKIVSDGGKDEQTARKEIAALVEKRKSLLSKLWNSVSDKAGGVSKNAIRMKQDLLFFMTREQSVILTEAEFQKSITTFLAKPNDLRDFAKFRFENLVGGWLNHQLETKSSLGKISRAPLEQTDLALQANMQFPLIRAQAEEFLKFLGKHL